ncbi:MFS general substrate transporter [Pseudovirgaria hyperparasitica]|uniref:MFS general substrate transporter n=1 Tax=Pseudovirgaria hyperparasitica TaxID=470096 RepID=A0A6A6VW98_9PEZI|nr:MFS general substrate transporter [Pseudovirgaria hyperparasitica]KAF2754968.1 MFS general substrate transporter [Pseudovirgaria hyperparasitica]
MPDSEPDERTRLVSSPVSPASPANDGADRPHDSSLIHLIQPRVLYLLTLQFITNFAYYHILAPRLRILELTLCRTYYSDHDPSFIHDLPYWPGYDITEDKCKLSSIQRGLSRLRAAGVFLDGLVVLLLSIPYGYIADRYGRKLVYSTCTVGLLLSTAWIMLICTLYDHVHIDSVLASSAFLVIGGGSSVQNAIAFTMGVDMTGTEDSSTILYLLLAMYYLGYICGNGLAPATMKYLWLPFCLAFICWGIALLLVVLMPSSQKFAEQSQTKMRQGGVFSNVFPSKISTRAWQIYYKARNTVRKRDYLVGIIALFPLMAVRGPVIELVLPYVSKRYHWSLANAGFLDAMSGIIGLMLSFFMLPVLVTYLKKHPSFGPIRAEGAVVRYSVCALGFGALIIAAAPSVGLMIPGYVIYATGAGGRTAILAIATSLVLPEEVARLNTVIITSEVLADLTLSPFIWYLWSLALDQGSDAALGIPFYAVTVVMCIVAAIFLYTTRDPDHLLRAIREHREDLNDSTNFSSEVETDDMT